MDDISPEYDVVVMGTGKRFPRLLKLLVLKRLEDRFSQR